MLLLFVFVCLSYWFFRGIMSLSEVVMKHEIGVTDLGVSDSKMQQI